MSALRYSPSLDFAAAEKKAIAAVRDEITKAFKR